VSDSEAIRARVLADFGKVDLAFPVLPARDIAATEAFYAACGFRTRGRWDDLGYLIVQRESMELHFFSHKALDRFRSDHGAYLRVADARALHDRLSELALPADGIPRLTALEEKPWGMLEFALVDPDGNLLRVGQPVAE
jgi:catechol 2,3-dioxygenase-like lactoylglutathione lyase family enzyme